ncbi:lipopolysaccharide biosynthesis protein [Sphingomonas sp.]|uniref:lipopolysaccharide biosynthesis protein n=1 Tax=Sphingomonas sp. TaxID=28214 RepID=UPI003AFFE08E
MDGSRSGPPPAGLPTGTEADVAADLGAFEAGVARDEGAEPAHRVVFRRMARNVGWLLGGRGFLGVASLGYLALPARALGPRDFGLFMLILAYGQTIANLVSFQSWQAVVRYGVPHVEAGRRDALARLVGVAAALDLAVALVGAGLGVVALPLAGHWLGWTTIPTRAVAAFVALLLLSTGTAASGVLRLVDRFDLLTYAEAVGPTIRLGGAALAWWLGATLPGFLAIWAGAAIAQAAATWGCAFAAGGTRLALGGAAFRQAVVENGRLLRFLVQTNLSASLGLLNQVGTLVVGGVAGPAAAGGFRLAAKLAKSLAKPVQLVARALFPEFARLVADEGRRDAATIVLRRVTWAATAVGAVTVIVVALAGRSILRLVTGHDYGFAYPYLVAFSIAAAIEVSGFALEPFLNASGRAGRVLGARAIGAGAYYALLAVLVPVFGAIAAAVALILANALVRLRLTFDVARLLRRRHPG